MHDLEVVVSVVIKGRQFNFKLEPFHPQNGFNNTIWDLVNRSGCLAEALDEKENKNGQETGG